ncbi:Uncharacterized protein, PA2063/DUF2235 family [Cognatiyoonia koreensis]|uniref:Uncharacterized protein, PA2063/DUF2235 family n=1 Tax=Cognatiyoonia koreensis TaxID=364200 RepID=A0A1I0QFP1_9RHOB|nr:DUF2235 domain-containing protein [Cognatiyoonia koreensis]SEW25779.1 Uncharacterized protein, PA2063/DUF2235 family [Cognatiyoonia koreensis]
MPLRDWFLGLIGRKPLHEEGAHRTRGPATHVIILDGTASSLDPGSETNAGLTFKLLREAGRRANLTVYYEAGIQWRDWRSTLDVMAGHGTNRLIRRAYGVIASRYRDGDKIILVGYSRGAFAARSLAGVIDLIGLLKADHATVSNIRTAYRHYESGAASAAAVAFRKKFCHPKVEIEAVAVWDTVKALGLRLPLIWRWTTSPHDFHSHALGNSIRNGFHALAIDERRVAYEPVMWSCPTEWKGHMEQVWFRGTHGDVGGQLSGHEAARPLSNIPLVWMLERLEMCGVPLPEGWHSRYPQDVRAPSIGAWAGWSKIFWLRRARVVGADPSESLHSTIAGTQEAEQAIAAAHS